MEISPAAIQKALFWLNKQDQNWSKYIKDSNMALKMYSKSHKKPSQASPFQKKLENFCETNFGVRLQKPTQKFSKPLNIKNKKPTEISQSPPPESSALSMKKPNLNPEAYKNFTFPLVRQDPSVELKEIKPDPEQNLKLKAREDSPSLPLNSLKQQISLDSKNLQILEEVKKEWNLKNKEEALNLLIQAGKRKLSN